MCTCSIRYGIYLFFYFIFSAMKRIVNPTLFNYNIRLFIRIVFDCKTDFLSKPTNLKPL